jgi:hypothetical protein
MRILLLATLTLVTACSSPLSPPEVAEPPHPGIDARFESQEAMTLATGEEIYIVGLYTAARGERFPEPTYMVQLGTRKGATASSSLYQSTYTFLEKNACDQTGCYDVMFLGGAYAGVMVTLRNGAAELILPVGEEIVAFVLPAKP